MASMRLQRSSDQSSESVSRTVTVNAAFFQEVKEVHGEVRSSVERIRRQAEAREWSTDGLHDLIRLLDELQELVGLYFRLEEGYGYFDDPVYVDARFSARASLLRAEHQTLYAEITRICDHAERLLYNGRLHASIDLIMARIAGFCDQLEAHEAREKELITEAFTHEVGGTG